MGFFFLVLVGSGFFFFLLLFFFPFSLFLLAGFVVFKEKII